MFRITGSSPWKFRKMKSSGGSRGDKFSKVFQLDARISRDSLLKEVIDQLVIELLHGSLGAAFIPLTRYSVC